MKFNFVSILKYGLPACAVVAAAKLIQVVFVQVKKEIAQRPVNEAVFVMSDALPCCRHNEGRRIVEQCRNPHCKAKLSHKIIEHINSAKHLICIAMYMLTMRQIAEAIREAAQRGVKVRIIADSSMANTSGTRINELQSQGIPTLAIYIAGNGDKYMHNKFCLIDVLCHESGAVENTHPVNGILINGSLNWTSNGFDRNWENVLFTSNDHLKSAYKKAFDYMWSRLADPQANR